jgi:hypothetical protein
MTRDGVQGDERACDDQFLPPPNAEIKRSYFGADAPVRVIRNSLFRRRRRLRLKCKVIVEHDL